MKTNKLILFSLLIGVVYLVTCKKVEKEMSVSTENYQNVLATSAEVNGKIIDLGEGATQYGHCYSTSQNPTVALPTKTEKGTPVIGKYISTLTNLSPSTKYFVKAYISRGNDVAYGSEINFITTAITTPGAPTSVVATAGNAQASITFTAPTSDGGSPITGYTATSSPGGLTGTGTASPITVTGLTNGTAYTFTVTANNTNGTGTASSPSNSVTPSSSSTVPGAPTGVEATAGNAQATVTFTAPASDGGSPITGYTVTSSPSGFIGTGSSNPITVTGLANGTAYTFTVTATNVNGTGPASIASNSVTPSTVPGAPTIGTATAGVSQATITFAVPISNGGSAITGYTATSSPGSLTGTATVSPITVTELTIGTAYTFTVTATNANGKGPASGVSNSVTPLFQDLDGNAYNTVTLGAQIWMKENLKTTKYRNGTSIPLVTDNTAWYSLTTPAYCWYNNDAATYKATYGALYNWYAVNTGNLCPTGWHVPTDAEWTTMENYLISNGYNYDGTTTENKIAKSLAATTNWTSSTSTGAVGNIDYPAKRNVTGFTALPGGGRIGNGTFHYVGGNGYWWTATADDAEFAWHRGLASSTTSVDRYSLIKKFGYSIRCVRD